MTKKGFMVSPVVFIALFFIAIAFSYYASSIDNKMAYSIKEVSSIEKGNFDIQKKQLVMETFAEAATYKCSQDFPYPCNKTDLENCVEGDLNSTFGDFNWEFKLSGDEVIKIELYLPQIKATNINMTSDIIYIEKSVDKNFVNWC